MRQLFGDIRGIALTEFAIVLPSLLLLGLTGAEMTNYVVTKMRISQVALHLADNAARVGTGTLLQQKTISESDIHDLLTGAGLQAGELDLYERGRVKVSSLENDPASPGKYRIRWQRCRGTKIYTSPYDGEKTALSGVGPTGRQVVAPANGATMWVEVAYDYAPLVRAELAPSATIVEFASMMVRDRRALDAGTNGIVPVSGVMPSTC